MGVPPERLRSLGLPGVVRACLFDVDGVLTRTANVHRAAWQDAFDPVLAAHDLPPFTEADYLAHVDGKPRLSGVRDLLLARGLDPAPELVATIGEHKNELLRRRLTTDGVAVFDESLRYLRAVRAAGLPTAAVTSSANGAAVLEGAGISGLLDVLVDGVVAAERGLAGKPAADTFLTAAAELGVGAGAAAVFEDSLAGVAAGRAGGFAHVVGVDRGGRRAELLDHGADVVVAELSELLEER